MVLVGGGCGVWGAFILNTRPQNRDGGVHLCASFKEEEEGSGWRRVTKLKRDEQIKQEKNKKTEI